MKKLRLVPAFLAVIALGACDTDNLLNPLPVDEISDEIAITDAGSAQAALVGAYSSLQGLYGGSWVIWTDLLTDDVEHTGTFGSFADGDLHNFRPNMGTIDGMWTTHYSGIDRVNRIIQKVSSIDGIDAGDANQIMGEAYAIRGLLYFNLVRAWGGVPLVLTPPASLDEAGQVARATAAEVWAQIESDLAQAATMLSGSSNDEHTFFTPGAVTAVEAKVALYQGEWGTAASKAQQLVNSGDYALVTNLRDAFTADGDPSAEDILRISFTATEWCSQGWWYRYDGRLEVGATWDIYNLYEPGDLRFDLNFDGTRNDGIQVIKWPTPIGAEDIHVVRYADVLLMAAEALAEQNTLSAAVDYLNQIRNRAGVGEYELGTDLVTQQDVLDAIYLERRLELAFEGERWHDLVRTGRAVDVLSFTGRFAPHEVLWPIPVGEMDTAPNLVQNPGY
ncbi:MAG: RagB/SusD family nutrient uptake outer membrane protein [Gemmatimonadetes bacterium]|nr:RagB/SusD family nutrient uptake outer membrane protein [Gemmatimonadota bacterium]